MSTPETVPPVEDGSRLPKERIWVSLYDFLLSKGYRLRPRYHPNWEPSWISRNVDPEYIKENHLQGEYEDFIPSLGYGMALDATRIPDEKPVWLKLLQSSGEELSILRATSLDGHRIDPRNHCVALLDVFHVPSIVGDYSIVVLPMLRNWYDPSPHLFVEAVDFIDQLLEGLAFLHDLNIYHGDIKGSNILMSADTMFPDGFNPLVVGRGGRSFALRDAAPVSSRLEVPVKYTYIDFEFGQRFQSKQERRLIIWDGGFYEMPEIYETYGDPDSSRTRPYDPFKADVWALGYFLTHCFLIRCEGRFPAIYPLLRSMVQHDPLVRSSAAECLKQFRETMHSLSWSLCYRLPPLRLICWGFSHEELQKAERHEARGYLEQLVRYLCLINGQPRLLGHM